MKEWVEFRFVEDSGKIRMQMRFPETAGEWVDTGSLLPTRKAAAGVYRLLVQVMAVRYRHDLTERPYRFTRNADAPAWPLAPRVLFVETQNRVQVVGGLGGNQTLGDLRFTVTTDAVAASEVMTAALTAITGFTRAATRMTQVPRLGPVRDRRLSAPPPAPAASVPADNPGIELKFDE